MKTKLILLMFIIILGSCAKSGRAWYIEKNGNHFYINGFPEEKSCAAFSNPQPMKKSVYVRQAYYKPYKKR